MTQLPASEVTSPPRRRSFRDVLPISFAVALMLLLGSADAWAKANCAPSARPESEAPAQSQPSGRPAESGRRSAADDYAQREARTPGLSSFEGGDIVIIGSTGLIILLLVILVILLL